MQARRSTPATDVDRQVDADFGAAPGVLATAIVPPSPSTMFLAIGEAEAGAAALGREVGIEDARQVGGVDADAAVGDDDRRRLAFAAS